MKFFCALCELYDDFVIGSPAGDKRLVDDAGENVTSGPISPASTASATVTGSDRSSHIARGKDRRDAGDKAERLTLRREERMIYNLGKSGMGSSIPAAANCGNMIRRVKDDGGWKAIGM